MGESTSEQDQPTDPEINVVPNAGSLEVGSQFEGFRVLSHVARNYIVNLYRVADAGGHEFLL